MPPPSVPSRLSFEEQAKVLMKEKKYEEASGFYAKALEKMVNETGDELAEACAPLYFAYGDALLAHVQANSNVFGGATQEVCPVFFRLLVSCGVS